MANVLGKKENVEIGKWERRKVQKSSGHEFHGRDEEIQNGFLFF